MTSSLFNFNPSWENNKTILDNSDLLPNSVRGLLIGSSNSGKTFLLFQVLLADGFLDYNNILIFSKSLNQMEYQVLIEGFKHGLTKAQIREIFEMQDKLKDIPIKTVCELISKGNENKDNITVSAYKTNIDVPDPSSMDSKKKNLMIFDDVVLEKQKLIEEYYVKGRHNNTQVFYISQSYFKIPKSTIRENSNLLILFKLNDIDIKKIHEQIVSSDMDIDTFKRFCKKVWDKIHKFMVIDRFNDDINWKYRDGFEIPFNKVINND